MRRLLLLGSGHISACLVNFLTRMGPKTFFSCNLTVASNVSQELEELSKKFPALDTHLLDVTGEGQRLAELVGKSDLVISLLPNHLHLPVVEACISLRVPMLHASYNTAELSRCHSAAVKNGVLILGELGLDPGIDHFLSLKSIHEIQEDRGKVTSFVSYCGGLPAPDCAGDNPLRYKFSWAPKTALGNVLNGAKFIRNKSIVEISPGGQILDQATSVSFLPELGALEVYPNRDSCAYLDKYGVGSKVQTMIRGTLRYAGFCSRMQTLVKLGLLSEQPEPLLGSEAPPISWRQFITHLLRLESQDDAELSKVLSREEMETLNGLGLLDETLLDKLGSPLESLSKHLERRLQFKHGEQDVVVLHIELEAKYPILSSHSYESGCGRKESREIDFVVYGDPSVDTTPSQPLLDKRQEDRGIGYSAMAKCVAYTLGIAAGMVLNGEIQKTGVLLPATPDIYIPILERLASYGLFAIERISEK